ncbi:MAG TPA: nucleoside transporter [Phycisphaerae bacterium]|nr:nucleoside transporter [Phycisphaerae bacterium]HRW53392.1 nucleoside transporter [Phycisphaerae bacterium]
MQDRDSQSGVIERLDRLYEFERSPVSEDHLCGKGYFAGAYAGEHVAATEFVIGALFVTWGAGMRDLIYGLALANLLAVLSWTFVCAPIATETRLTLYWYLRKICGPAFTTGYNVLNAILFCVLAGCMITVSASAVRLPFGIPPQTEWYPTDARFVLTVFLVGGVVVFVAIAGFKRLAAFSSICSPWMLLMFVAGALVALPALGEATHIGAIRSFEQFRELGERAIWTGRTPDGELSKIGFWHIAAFAWICNLAMHIGLSDMAILRYARRTSYGAFSGFGMFLGHYLAWLAAGVMGAGAALAQGVSLTQLDSGAVAYEMLGVAGAIAVVIAGWTTSNPTLYRAGLALQVITPGWPRWLVTLIVGIVTTIIACFPFVFTGLLDFVGIYGLLLVPAGAIVVTEHWLFPKLGMTRYWSEMRGSLVNWPAMMAWGAGIALALGLYMFDVVHLFFLFPPVYVLTVVVYLILASFAGARSDATLPAASSDRRQGDGAAQAPSTTSARRQSASRRPLALICGLLALLSLLACIALAVNVYLAPPAEYAERLAGFRRWLMVPTLVYFVAASMWRVVRRPAPVVAS